MKRGKCSKNQQKDKFLSIFNDNLLEIHTLKLRFYSTDKMAVYCTYQLVADIYMYQQRCQLQVLTKSIFERNTAITTS